MRIRIPLFTFMPIRIRLFTLLVIRIRILLLIKVSTGLHGSICESQYLYFVRNGPLWLHFEPLMLLYFHLYSDSDPAYHSSADPDAVSSKECGTRFATLVLMSSDILPCAVTRINRNIVDWAPYCISALPVLCKYNIFHFRFWLPSPNSERNSIMPCAVKSLVTKIGFLASSRRSLLS
jgi:hypothetical protein